MKEEIFLNSNPYVIRRAAIGDIDSLIALRVSCLRDCGNITDDAREEEMKAPLRRYLENTLPSGEFVSWVAEYEGRLVACSGICFYAAPPDGHNLSGRAAHIMNMYTSPEHRGKGLATKLVDKVVNEARERGCEKVWLTASAMGRPVYERYGFQNQDRDMVYFL